MKLPFDIIALDIECTDSNPELGSIIQLSAVTVNRDFKIEKEKFDIYIQPLDSYRKPQAMSVNKITEQQLITAYLLPGALKLFEYYCNISEKFVLASWGNYFDIPFLKKQYEKIKRDWPFGYKSMDLKTIAIWEMAKRNQPLSSGLSRFLKSLNMGFEGTPHNALDDIINTVNLLKELNKNEKRKDKNK